MAKRLLDENLTKQLAALTPRITKEIELVASLDERPASADLAQLLEDIAALSPLISYRRDDDALSRKPGFQIKRVGTDIAVSFAGIPMGHEFSSLVLALLQVGGNPIKESPEIIEQIANLEGEYEFVTYFSLSCQNCPTVIQALNTMSVINPKIKHIGVEGSLFQDEVQQHNVLAVPSIFLNGKEFAQGRNSLEQLLNRLDSATATKTAEKMNNAKPYDAVVVGEGPAGCAAAIYLARKGLSCAIVGERFGGQVNDTAAIENFISIPQIQGPQLAANLERHVRDYDVDIYDACLATGITPANNSAKLHQVHIGEGTLKARTVVIATGAKWRLMNVPGENEYRNKGVTFCPHCDAPLFKGKKVAVIGGGNSGIEAAIDISAHASEVVVLEYADSCRADEVLMRSVAANPKISIITNANTTEVIGDTKQVTGLKYVDRVTNISHEIDLSGIFVQIGLSPNTEWLTETLELNNKHEIVTDERAATSIPGIFAAGDCADTLYKQIVIAQSDGALAGLGAWDYLIRNSVTQN